MEREALVKKAGGDGRINPIDLTEGGESKKRKS